MRILLLTIGLLAIALLHGAHCQTAPTNTDTVIVNISKTTTTINKGLFGSQYNFFSSPIREKLSDKHLLESWKTLPVTFLRYPGGTWADHYLWDKPGSSYYAVGDANSVVTPGQFIANCRAIGAEPIFQVNTSMLGGEGNYINPTKIEDIRIGADRAARWVKEANIEQKWNVKYWEIGNEVWIWLKPGEYALFVKEYSAAMRAVDPSIKIIACGLTGKVGPFQPSWLKFPDDPDWSRPEISNNAEDWNQALAENAKDSFDYIAPHIYIESGDSPKSAQERFADTNVQITKNERLAHQVEWAGKMGNNTKIALTEWACNFRQSVPVLKSSVPIEEQYYYSMANGLNTAYFFGKILESAGECDIAILHALDDFQTLWYWPKKELAKKEPLLHPIYLAMELWGRHVGKTALKATIPKPPMLSEKGEDYPAIYAFASEDSSNVYVVLINLDPQSSHSIALAQSPNLRPRPAKLTWLKSAFLTSQNFGAWNGEHPPEVALSETLLPLSKGNWQADMPPHSMAGLILSKN